MSHQSKWEKSVFEVYEDATVPWEWTEILKKECDRAGIDYFSTPYDFEAVDMLDPYVSVFKIGSGDITWPEMLQKVASKKKPVILATGASDTGEVQRAVQTILKENSQLVLMQCNTNYTGSLDNFAHIHLQVLKTFDLLFPEVILGLSDHTPEHATVLGAIALGARVVEKHFTDDTNRVGPDHPFSMTPQTWRVMVDRTRELELALGNTVKEVAENEKDTVIIQRRCLRARQDLKAGTKITRDMIDVLRPAPVDAIFPYEISKLENKYLKEDVSLGTHFQWTMFES
jgi:sialic acid synthase SpsE